MPSKLPRLRGKSKARKSPYPLSEFPDDVVFDIGKQIVHHLAVGHADLTGDNFADIFAKAISGQHFHKPVGITDVIWDGCSWSAKTVKATKPFEQVRVRLISGRNDPNYSYGISDSLADIKVTGRAVLNIWNQRVNQSLNEYDDLRIVVFARNMDTLEFTLFEYEAGRYAPADYQWEKNKGGNLEGYEKSTGNHKFTWQPGGCQFTVIKVVPGSACKFRITRHPGLLEPQHVLQLVQFNESWIERVQ